MTSPALSIIVVSYNTRDMTLACLRSVFQETRDTAFELIVLDNASADGSAKAIQAEFGDRIRFVAAAENLGFAAGNNRAAENARGEYLLLLNPDTVVLDGAIDRLFEFARKHPDAGIWGGRTLFGDGSLNPASCWSRQTLSSLIFQALGLTSLFRRSSFFNPEGMGGWNREGVRAVDIVSGCFLLVRRDMWQALGGFREIFFMYGEEADLCLRARALGARPMVTSAATIIHHGGASEKVRAGKLVRLLRAKTLLIRFHFPAAGRRLGTRLLYLWPLSRYFAHSALAALGRSASAEARKVWAEVLHHKNEWFDCDARERRTQG